MKVLKSTAAIINHLRASIPKTSLENNYAFYSSVLDGITTGKGLIKLDPIFMSIPLDDKIVHRAFGIFETFYIKDYLIHSLPKKMEALYRFIETFKLRPPFDCLQAQATVIALARAANKSNCQITMWISPGPGDYSLFINVKVELNDSLNRMQQCMLCVIGQWSYFLQLHTVKHNGSNLQHQSRLPTTLKAA